MKYKAIFADNDELMERKNFKITPKMKKAFVWIGIFVLFNLLALLFSYLCREIFYHDNAVVWNMAKDIAHGEVVPLWSEVYLSIINQNVNYICALPSALFIKIFGDSHAVFVLSLVNCYLVPSYFLIYKLVKRTGKAPVVTMIIIALSFPLIVFLTFNGFAETGGLVMCLGCFLIYFNSKKSGVNWYNSLIIGILLSFLTLWDSWYIFFAISFITAMIADCILLKKNWYAPILTIMAMLVILARFFSSFMFSQLLEVYGNGNLTFNIRDNLHMITRYFGLVPLLFLIADSIIVMITYNEKRVIFPLIQIIVCYAMFSAQRIHGQGHMLMYLPAAVVLMSLCVRRVHSERMLAAILCMAFLQTINIFIPWKQPNGIDEIKHCTAFNSFSMLPYKRDDVSELLAMKKRLDERVSEGEYLGVLSYSDAMNDELLRNLENSLGKNKARINYIARTIPYFDSENTDISPLMNANYMLVAYPLQTQYQNQVIVSAAFESFENYADIAAAYEEQFDFETIINGVTYKLYKRVRSVTPTERIEFEMRYKSYLNN